jgi:hypothetical protein
MLIIFQLNFTLTSESAMSCLSFTYTEIIDVVVFVILFGCIARFSNGGWKNLLTKLNYEIRQRTLFQDGYFLKVW